MSKTHIERICPTDVAFKAKDGKAIPLRCGSWNCPTCSTILAEKWAEIAAHGVDMLGVQTFFWTLTMPATIRTQARAYEILPVMWDTFRKAVQRNTDAWLYIAFVEGQPNRGYMPHFHIISTAKAWKRLKDMAVSAGFGHQAKELPINSQGAADYVAKYASKQGWMAPPKFRRVRCSRNWPKPPEPEKEPYLVRSNKETLFGFLERVAYKTHRDVGEVYEDYMLCMGNPIDAQDWEDANRIAHNSD